MDCPRCGARLSRISLGDRRSVYCEECRFADVASDHTRISDDEETWDDAIRRFRAAHADGMDGSEEPSSGDVSGDRAAGNVVDGDAPVETVSGIDPACADRLAATGITTLGGLAAADAEAVADTLDVPESTVADSIDRARQFLADTDDADDDGRGDAGSGDV